MASPVSGPPAPASRRSLRTLLVSGLLVWIPLAVTFFVLQFLVGLVDRIVLLFPEELRPEAVLGFHVPGLGLVIALAILLATGALFANLLGKRLVAWAEGLLGRVPFVGPLYRGSKQVAETVLSQDSKSFRKVVLVPFPYAASRTIGFLTGAPVAEVTARAGVELVSVFVPTTPNPTSGFILFLPAADVIELDMTVEEAIRLEFSLGLAAPEWPRRAPAPT